MSSWTVVARVVCRVERAEVARGAGGAGVQALGGGVGAGGQPSGWAVPLGQKWPTGQGPPTGQSSWFVKICQSVEGSFDLFLLNFLYFFHFFK